MIRFSESGAFHVWHPSKGDPILTLDYPEDLSMLIGKPTHEILEAFNDLLIKSLKHYSEHLPVPIEIFEGISKEFRGADFLYSIELQKRRSPNKKDYGVVHVDMTPEKAIFFGTRLSSKGEALSKIELVETIPSLIAVAGVVEKTKWLSAHQFLIQSRIGIQYKLDFEKDLYTVEYEGGEKRKRLAVIELRLLSPRTTLKEVLDLQAEKESLLFE